MAPVIKPVHLADQYMDAFFGVEPFELLSSILAESLIFEGPFLKTFSSKEYLQKLYADPPLDVAYKIEEIYESENSVCFIYMYYKSGVATRMAQTFETAHGKINHIKLIFDTAAFNRPVPP